ncbi:RDD family protein [Streptomyces sp. NPDC059698]|uniref:RDD family protein n=1 Tax=unclassified Streptomyces TaxID=2593676 RepID=UPI00093B4D64|nr:RDD family protein [Streptomyces sp. CB02366]OKJ39570.1 hypothetical protein AMK24_08040 [Streptomyces sp. CB02366]
MSNDQPTPGQPPEDDDPFLKKPQEPPPPSSGQPYGGTPPPPPPNDPYGSGGGFGAPDPLAGMPPLAEPGKRILARLIDFLVISIPLYLISLPWGGAVDVNGDGDDGFGDAVASGYGGQQLVWSIIGLVVYVAYDTYFTHKDGRTLGKRLLKMRVAMLNDGRAPDTGAALMRAVVLWAPALLCCPCLWWLINIVLMFTDKPYRQGLQDKAAKTVVVAVR